MDSLHYFLLRRTVFYPRHVHACRLVAIIHLAIVISLTGKTLFSFRLAIVFHMHQQLNMFVHNIYCVMAFQRESTRKMYVAKVKVFKDWPHSQNSPLCTSSVAEFLLKKFDDGSASTIEGYRMAIANAYPEISLSREHSISQLILTEISLRPLDTCHQGTSELSCNSCLGHPLNP